MRSLSLLELQTQLSELNLELEQKIILRTQELTSVNAGLAQEIAERTRAEEASREANERVRLLLDSTARDSMEFISTATACSAIQRALGCSVTPNPMTCLARICTR